MSSSSNNHSENPERSTSDGIRLHSVRMIPVGSVRLDPDNPNVMSEEQMDGLRESMRRFGYLDPIVVDEEMVMADGEHRLQVYKEFGQAQIPAYVLKLSNVERRLLRQTKNKLHGEHDFQKDASELKILYDSGSIGDLARLIAVPEDTLRVLASSGVDFDPKQEWSGMPAYESEWANKLVVKFQTDEDRKAFGEKIGQEVTSETKSLWIPPKTEKNHYVSGVAGSTSDES